MRRDRLTQQKDPDAKIAKDLRSAFIAEYSRAVYVPLEGTKSEIERLEAAAIATAPAECVRRNSSTNLYYPAPVDLVDGLLNRKGYSPHAREAVERQMLRCQGMIGT